MNKITITLNDQNQIKLKSQNPISFEDLLQITQTAVLGHANQIMGCVPEEDEEKVRGFMFDLMNQAFSRTLEFFAPEYELHPDLTAQAILEAENQLIERKFNERKSS